MKHPVLTLLTALLLAPPLWGQNPAVPDATSHFWGRRQANPMHHTGAPWLIRATREKEENTSLLIEALNIKPGWTVCDLGCGNGYHSLKLAKRVGPNGKIYGVDIQKQMLRLLEKRAAEAGVKNVVPILGQVHDPNLKPASCDMILLVDVYHEMSHPEAMLTKMRQALKPNGQLVLVEFRAEDPAVPIKLLHKMSRRQMVKEVCPSGFRVVRQFDHLPWQHVMFFQKTKLEALKVLFIGNQDMAQNNLPQITASLARTGGRRLLVKQVAGDLSTSTLEQPLAALESFKPDVVVLQAPIPSLADNTPAPLPATVKLNEAIGRAGAKLVMLMPWAKTTKPYTLKTIKRICLEMGDRFGAQVAPVGLAFESALLKNPKAGLHKKNGAGPTLAGSYLAACVLYATITGQDPRSLRETGQALDVATRSTLQKIAWQSLNQSPSYSGSCQMTAI